ncbi:hypothetical protein C8J57DRAFT_1662821 [Mycena rebaudengoi]|nr:hypothetical protein C8J57DRAFT_1662821 [Mycena rebaudengoi]
MTCSSLVKGFRNKLHYLQTQTTRLPDLAAMSGAETAASLFGDDDPAADLFASLGTEDSLQPGHDTSISPDFPNNTTAPASDVFATQDSQAGVHSSWLETPQSYGNEYISQQPESYQPELSTTAAQLPNSKLQDVATGGTSYAPSQVKRQSYEPQAYAAPATGVQKPTYDPYTPATKYAVPANPPGQSAYASPGKKAYALPPLPPSNPAQSTYSPYAPPTPSYAPSTPTYAPSTPSYAPTTPSATHTSPYSSMGKAPYVSQKVAVVPPPPPPAPVLNRPKLSNAYDPPFPTTRSTKRGASSSSLRSSAYAAYATPTPPPPPPGGQFSSSGYPLPPPLPPPHNPDPGALRASVSPPSWGSTNGTVVANSAYQNLDVNRHPATAPPVPSNPHLYTAGQAQYTDMSNSTIAAGATDPYSHPSVPAALGADTQVARPLPPARTTLSRTSSRSNSILSQASDRSADASLVSPPHSGDVNRTSSPASFSTRSRTATPDPYAPPPTNGSGTAGISPTSSTVDRVPSPCVDTFFGRNSQSSIT